MGLRILLLALAFSWAPGAAVARAPVLVELFTSQGCVGCGDAHRLLGDLEAEGGVVALTYNVDYWDYLGWRDTFARPEFAARQRAYATQIKTKRLSTPQMVVGGAVVMSGRQPDRVRAVIAASNAAPTGPEVRLRLERNEAVVRVGVGRAGGAPATVWVAQYRPGPQSVAITAGENRGRSMTHHNVVTDLRAVGTWSGSPRLFSARCDPACAVIVQERDGPVIATHTAERVMTVARPR